MSSLRALTLFFLTAFAAATAMAVYLTDRAAQAALVSAVDRRIEQVADAMLSEVTPGDARAILRRIHGFAARRDTGDIGFELEDARGHRLGGNVVIGRVLPLGDTTLRARDGIPGLSAGRAQTRDAGGGLRLITVAETEPIDGYAATRWRLYLLGFGALLTVVLAGTLSFGLIVRQRIGEVRATAAAIIDGDLARRVPVPAGGGAFAAQAQAFNRALDRIAALMTQLREVSSDVAHDLRTPLARLRARLARLAEATPSDSDRDAELAAAVAECDALLGVFGAILRIAEMGAGERRAGFRALDLGALAQQVCDTLAPAATEGARRLDGGPFAPLSIRGDPSSLSQALINLVENALHHTPPGTRVTVTLAQHDAAAVLAVADDGPGIPRGSHALALRRFGRLDVSRHLPGHGLGLPLVEAVAKLHGGTLTLGDAAPGLRATITLPLPRG
ncbi:HAMP domain-containing sensor histidine kinase [Sphingomonas sp. BK235]|uniref:sensor histidine kinase n=1 Tax=Sphingomonas sp. BK235 TaxID=2512131 RepID=UPI00104C09EE|nr:HAMP domain-containing sensor histidine kinase [Sphingomonas sp. BK235]TCP33143.1 signal transduction histidine kinase [Sphingomonas sp. BK235]